MQGNMRKLIMIACATIALATAGFSVGSSLSKAMAPSCYDCADNDPCKNSFGCLGYPECVCWEGECLPSQ